METALLNASDALRAHTQCKYQIGEQLLRGKRCWCMAADFNPDPRCALVRFIRECECAYGNLPELHLVKTAHATVHTVAIGLAQKCAAGQEIDLEAEFASWGNFGAASSSLVMAIWNLEKKLHSMAA